MDTGYRADPEAFARQMECFERMRQTERDFRAGKFDWKPAAEPGYPKGVIDLRRMTGRDLPSIEPGRVYG